MAATISRAAAVEKETPNAVELADLFCVYAEGRVRRALSGLNAPEDRPAYRAAQGLVKGDYSWLEAGIVH